VHVAPVDRALPWELTDRTVFCRVFPQLPASSASPWCFVRHGVFDLGKKLMVSGMMILDDLENLAEFGLG